MTFNVHGLRDDRRALVAVLRDAAPDVVAVQEPPRGPLGRLRFARLARASGLRVAVLGGGARTTALLARAGLDAEHGRAVRLPRAGGRVLRGASLVEVKGVRVIGIHLGLYRDERVLHSERVLALVTQASGPCVVAGDFNEAAAGTAARRLREVLGDAGGSGATFPATDPQYRIDLVLVSPHLTVEAARVIRDTNASRASDHLPVVVDLRIGDAR